MIVRYQITIKCVKYGIVLLFKIFRQMKAEFLSNYRGPCRETLEHLVMTKQLQTVFNFKGNSPTLNKLFSRYDYLLQPTHLECFSLSILESFAANVPLIITNVGGDEEAVKNVQNCYIFKAKDVEALMEIFMEVCTGKRKIIKNTPENIRYNISIEIKVERYVNLILES